MNVGSLSSIKQAETVFSSVRHHVWGERKGPRLQPVSVIKHLTNRLIRFRHSYKRELHPAFFVSLDFLMSSLQEHHRLCLPQIARANRLLKGFCQIKTHPRWKLWINRRILLGWFCSRPCRVTCTSPGSKRLSWNFNVTVGYFQSLNICRRCDRSLKVTSWHWNGYRLHQLHRETEESWNAGGHL